MSQLTTDQIQDLADIVIDQCGSCLSDDELTDEIAQLLEDVAGFETASEQMVRRVINQVRSHYHGTSQHHQDI